MSSCVDALSFQAWIPTAMPRSNQPHPPYSRFHIASSNSSYLWQSQRHCLFFPSFHHSHHPFCATVQWKPCFRKGWGEASPAEAPEDKPKSTVGVQADCDFPGGIKLTLQLNRTTKGTSGCMRHLKDNSKAIKMINCVMGKLTLRLLQVLTSITG